MGEEEEGISDVRKEKRAPAYPTHCPLLLHSTHPGPGAPGHIPHSRDHLVVREAPVREGREVRGTVSSLGEASQGVDLTGPSILVPPEIDGISRIGGGVLVKEVVGSEEETHTVAHSHCVGNVLCMWDVQEASCHPGHQILAGEKEEDHEA